MFDIRPTRHARGGVGVDGGWWMVDGGWWMVDGGWWMVGVWVCVQANDQLQQTRSS